MKREHHERVRGGRVWAVGMMGVLVVGLLWPRQVTAQAAPGGELRQLREELDQARREIQRLRDENARLRGGVGGGGAGTVVSPGAGIPGPGPARNGGVVPGMTLVPMPIEDGAAVSVEQLLGEYRTSTLAGDARYKGRRFRLEGVVRGFQRTFGGLTWIVELQGNDQDKLGIVRCSMSVPGMSDFRPTAGDRVLEARRPFRAWQKVLEIGQPIVLEGVGAGAKDAVVVLKDARPAG